MDQELEEYQGRQGKRQRADTQALSARDARFATNGNQARGARDTQGFVTRGHQALGERDAAHFGTAGSYQALDVSEVHSAYSNEQPNSKHGKPRATPQLEGGQGSLADRRA